LPEDFEGWTTTAPKAGFHGNQRHFFQKPDEKLLNKLMSKDKGKKDLY